MVNRILACLMAFAINVSLVSCGIRTEKTTTIATTVMMQQSSNATASANESTAARASTMTTSQGTTAAVGIEAAPLNPEILSRFPGALRLMTLSKDDIVALFGEEPDVFEDKAQGVNVLEFESRNLVLRWDELHNTLLQIRIVEEKYNISSGSHARFDVDGDGNQEAVATYEDANGIGHVVVYQETDGSLIAATQTDSFGGGSTLSFEANAAEGSERLIVLDTLAENACNVLSYIDGKLISVMPQDDETLASEATVQFREDFTEVSISFASIGQSIQCPIPQRLTEVLAAKNRTPEYRFIVNRKPLIGASGLVLHVRTSLQVKLADVVPNHSNGVALDRDSAAPLDNAARVDNAARYPDIGFVMQDYRYMGKGEWKNLETSSSAKYTVEQVLPIGMNDLHIGEIWLFSPLYDLMEQLGIAEGTYETEDLMNGVIIATENLHIQVSHVLVSGLSLEKGSSYLTERGLGVGMTRESVLALYGLPDKGYYEDNIWTWWYIRDWQGETVIQPEDLFRVVFRDNIVYSIDMRGTVSN